MKQRRELVEAIEGQETRLKIKSDIEVAQEVESDNPIYAMLFGDGIAEGFNILHPGISEAEGLEDYLGDKMSLGGIAEGGKVSYRFKGVTDVN